MKITFLSPPLNLMGGTLVMKIYAERLQARGHDVTIVSQAERMPTYPQRARALLRGNGWQMRPVPAPHHLEDSSLPQRVTESFRPIVDADVPDGDFVIATFWRTAAWTAALSPGKGVKAYFMQDYGAPGQEIEDLIPTWQLGMHMITISQFLVDLIHEHCGPLPVSLVPNSVDQDVFRAPPRGKQPVPTVGFVYREAVVKGWDIAIEAFRLARRELPELRLRMFGPHEIHQPLPDGAEFTLRPPSDALADFYASCDVWLFASRREGFGLPVLEAMACRTPVITTPAGGTREIVARGGGVLVDTDDAETMASEIVRICSLPDAEWRALSDAAHANVAGYTWEDATDLFEAALERASSA